MKLYSKTFAQKLSNLTSRGSYLAVYGILAPIFFVAGAGLEFTMIHWKPNGINFYDTYKKNRAKEIATVRLEEEELKKEIQDLIVDKTEK